MPLAACAEEAQTDQPPIVIVLHAGIQAPTGWNEQYGAKLAQLISDGISSVDLISVAQRPWSNPGEFEVALSVQVRISADKSAAVILVDWLISYKDDRRRLHTIMKSPQDFTQSTGLRAHIDAERYFKRASPRIAKAIRKWDALRIEQEEEQRKKALSGIRKLASVQ